MSVRESVLVCQSVSQRSRARKEGKNKERKKTKNCKRKTESRLKMD